MNNGHNGHNNNNNPIHSTHSNPIALSLLLLGLPTLANGQTIIAGERPLLPIPQSAVLEQNGMSLDFGTDFYPNSNNNPTKITSDDSSTNQSEPDNQPNLAQQQEQAVTTAIQNQSFDILEQLLAQPLEQGFNPLLKHDAQAALALHKREYDDAINHYQQILENSPESAGVRLDMAVSLFMDRRFKEAKQAFIQIKETTDEQSKWHHLANQYLKAIAESEKWRPEISGNYVQTDNVNNATENETIKINGMTFRKRADDRPQSARGLAYQVGLQHERNLTGHHYLGVNVSAGGVHYFGKPEYSDQNIHLESSYHHRSAKQDIGITPFYIQRWVGNNRYNRSLGLRADYSYQFGKTWGGYLSLQREKIHYQDETNAEYYDGFSQSGLIRLHKQFGQNSDTNLTLFGGIQADKIHRNSRSESSDSQGIHAGLRFNRNMWGTRLYVRYNHRKYDDKHYLYGINRKDNELRGIISVSHKKIAWNNIMPELNYVYDKYKSNLDLYNRNSGQFYLSMNKSF